jgi:hypothetical protein
LKHMAAASAAAMLLILTPSSRPAAAEFLYKQPCTIEVFADHQPSVYTDCVVRSSMSHGADLDVITLPDGRKFRIKNAGPDESGYPVCDQLGPSPARPCHPPRPNPSEIWFLNGEHARKTGTAAQPCYQNARVRICIE